MELTHSFTVPAPIDEAWTAFNDLERIAPCFPGASLTSYDGETFEGVCKVKLGPISLQYGGSGSFVERDEAAGRAVIEAKGKDKRGNGTAAATITAQLAAHGDDATDVEVKTDLNITGKPAQFGRGVMQDVSDKLLGQFASCLETKLGTTPEAEADEPAAPAVTAGEDAAAAAATSTSETTAGEASAAAETPAAETADVATPAAEAAAAEAPAAELDLGTTVLPVLLKRYAPYLVGAILVLVVLKKLLGRRG